MSFSTLANTWQSFDFTACFNSIHPGEVRDILDRAGRQARLEPRDLLTLLSPAAESFLEPMAQIARNLTCQHFGRTISLYAPMYISDFCCNHCTYCGFNARTHFPRTRLTLEEIDREAKAIADTGIRHILLLTGEAPDKTPLSYLEDTCRIMTRYFSSIALEIFPMAETDYRLLKQAGADSLTVYQEVYDPAIYKTVHPKGPKSDYTFRLLTPERGAAAGFRAVNIGPLFGLGDPASEAFMAGLHARYLEQACPDVEISLSLPRMTRAGGAIAPRYLLSDRHFVQTLLAWRLFMPRAGITISTRESAAFRDRLLPLGVTRYSAGSRTDVGGYAVHAARNTVQFEVTDTRSVDEVAAMIRNSGYQPVFKDWEVF
ncbi:MAG: 2-iminoacetate synthase ThiH [Desulfotignum sp.]